MFVKPYPSMIHDYRECSPYYLTSQQSSSESKILDHFKYPGSFVPGAELYAPGATYSLRGRFSCENPENYRWDFRTGGQEVLHKSSYRRYDVGYLCGTCEDYCNRKKMSNLDFEVKALLDLFVGISGPTDEACWILLDVIYCINILNQFVIV